MPLHIAVCCGQVPFRRGGAEVQTEALAAELRERGHAVDIIRIPFRWYPKSEILKGYMAWRLINLEESDGQKIDRVIALKFPSFVVKHPYKITWLIQQFRQAYDLFGTEYSDLDKSEADTELREAIRRIDTQTLSESRHIFTNAANTGKRLLRYNGLESEPLYVPPALDGQFYSDSYGDYVLSICRLDRLKRVDQLVRAMGEVRTPVRCRIAGRGDEADSLKRLARAVGAVDRIDFLGYVNDREALDLYARSLAVYYGPLDEDYGLSTVEAMKSQRPVLTTTGSGGVLEFVEDGVTGYVTPAADSTALAQRIDELYADRALASRMGSEGQERVVSINWNQVIERLLEV